MSNDPVEITLADVSKLPPVVDLNTAAMLLGIGRTTAQTLARNDDFPVPVFRAGSVYRVPTAPILRLLGLQVPGGNPSS